MSKAKTLISLAWLKNWNHSRPRSSGGVSPRYSFFQGLPTNGNRTIITMPFWWKEGRSRWNSVEEIILQVPSLDPRFSILIDLCSCDFQAEESSTVQVWLYSFKKHWQDFRTTPYINYAYGLCSKETIGITIVRRWDYFALFLLVFKFSF